MSFYSHFKGLVKRVRVNRSMETLLFTLLKWEAILLRAMGSSIKRPSQMLPRTGHITQDSKHFCSPDEMSISSKITLLGEVNFCDYSAKQQSQAVRVVAEIEKVEKNHQRNPSACCTTIILSLSLLQVVEVPGVGMVVLRNHLVNSLHDGKRKISNDTAPGDD